MGMSSSDDEARIMEDQALLEWARQAPENPGYDRPMTEEERIAHDEAVKKWHGKRPKRRDPYANDKR